MFVFKSDRLENIKKADLTFLQASNQSVRAPSYFRKVVFRCLHKSLLCLVLKKTLRVNSLAGTLCIVKDKHSCLFHSDRSMEKK